MGKYDYYNAYVPQKDPLEIHKLFFSNFTRCNCTVGVWHVLPSMFVVPTPKKYGQKHMLEGHAELKGIVTGQNMQNSAQLNCCLQAPHLDIRPKRIQQKHKLFTRHMLPNNGKLAFLETIALPHLLRTYI